MTSPFGSFRPDTIDPTKLEPILLRYLAYERVRWFRSLLVRRFAVLLFACWTLTTVFQLFPYVAWQAAVLLVGATTAAVLVAEFSARRHLTRELRQACRSESL